MSSLPAFRPRAGASRGTRQLGRSSRRRRDRVFGSTLLVPAGALFAVFVFYPLVRVGWMSLQGSNIFGQSTDFVGLSNFSRLFADPQFGETLVHTAIFCAGVVVGQLIVGLLAAVPVSTKLRGVRVFRAFLVSPMAASAAVGSVAFGAILAPGTGILDSLITDLGGQPVQWLTSSHWALVSVIGVTVWCNIGFTVILLVGALGAIDPEIIEAARVDGAGPIRTFWSVTLPLLTPTLFFLVVTGAIAGLTTFAQIQILTQGGPAGATTTLVYDIYVQAFAAGSADFGSASAVGLILFVVVLALSLVQFGVLERRVHYA